MKLLAIDTSTDSCSVALRAGDAVRVETRPGSREQTLHVLPLVRRMLDESGLALRDLDAIACTLGPGAFTGVRVGVSVVQGLAYGAQVPAIGVSTLAALAQRAVREIAGSEYVLPLLDARMGELYAGAYRCDTDGLVVPLAPDRLARPGDIVGGLPEMPPGAAWQCLGSGCALVAFDGASVRTGMPALEPDARDVLALAERAWRLGETVPAEKLLPVYLRDTVAWKKLGEQGKP